MKKLRPLLAASALVSAAVLVPASPAAAAGVNIIHKSPDDGYSAPFRVQCGSLNGGDTYYIYPGSASATYCGSRATWVYVNPGTHIVCLTPAGWWQTMFDRDNYWEVVDFSRYCVYQLD